MLPILTTQDPTEGVRAAEGAAWPARDPCWELLGVWGLLRPPRRGRSPRRGQAATTTQRPPGGPDAHPGGTQQTAGVSAPPPPTATAPGDITLICWTVLSLRSHRLLWEWGADRYTDSCVVKIVISQIEKESTLGCFLVLYIPLWQPQSGLVGTAAEKRSFAGKVLLLKRQKNMNKP